MQVQALIQAAGSGARLGLGPKAFVMLEGRTLLERALDPLRGVTNGIIVAVAAAEIARAQQLLGDRATIIAGGASRSDTTRRLVAAATAPWLLLHDVVHPFATADLVNAVLEGARAHRVCAPAVLNSDFGYGRDGTRLRGPGELLIGQKPVAFPRDAALGAYAAFEAGQGPADPSLLDVFACAGIATKFVEGSPRNIKITGPADLAIACAMLRVEA